MPIDLEIDRYCIGCGYNIRGLTSDRCPECGLQTAAGEGSAIPWEGRKDLGLRRAFERTAWIGAFRAKRLADARAFPVDAKSAFRFRLLVATLAALPPAILLWIAIAVQGGTGFLSVWTVGQPGRPLPLALYAGAWEAPVLWSAGATRLVVLPIGLFLTIYLITAAPRLWFGSGNDASLRKRAADLSAYLFSPLIALIIPTLAAALAWQTNDPTSSRYWPIQSTAILVVWVGTWLIVLLCLVNSARFVAAVCHCGSAGAIWRGAGIALVWLLAVAIGLGLFPMLAGLIWLMFDSLRW